MCEKYCNQKVCIQSYMKKLKKNITCKRKTFASADVIHCKKNVVFFTNSLEILLLLRPFNLRMFVITKTAHPTEITFPSTIYVFLNSTVKILSKRMEILLWQSYNSFQIPNLTGKSFRNKWKYFNGNHIIISDTKFKLKIPSQRMEYNIEELQSLILLQSFIYTLLFLSSHGKFNIPGRKTREC